VEDIFREDGGTAEDKELGSEGASALRYIIASIGYIPVGRYIRVGAAQLWYKKPPTGFYAYDRIASSKSKSGF
jgi:hypothetical protein